ncbi:MAG: LacI family DNA-binding transcriptional regulator [Pseudomonadota bacterium]
MLRLEEYEMRKRVTLKDIANKANVHVSTVSRALDLSTDAAQSSEAALRIRTIANEMGYRPNRVAAGLRTQRTMTIGVMLPDITNTLFPPIVRGIESILEPRGYASIIVNTDSSADRERQLIDVLADRGVDGIIHTAVLSSDPSIVGVAASGMPVVTLNRKIDGSDVPYVINDESMGIRSIFALLHSFGHRRIAHLAGPSDLSTGQLRLAAFHAAAREFGLYPDGLLVETSLRFDEDEGRRAATAIHARAPETTAILCANDRLALGALQHFKSIGLDCPSEISITGFNDMPFLNMITPGLTTVRVQQFRAGAKAASLLLDMIDGNHDRVPRETILPVHLVERESVAKPRDAHQRRLAG